MNINKKIYLAVLILAIFLSAGLLIDYGQKDAGVTAAKFVLDEQSATIQAIQQAMPAVASIVVYDQEKVVEIRSGGQSRIIEKRVNKGHGTGFLISADGYILTNKHVVEAAEAETAQYKVILHNKKEYYAALIGKDPLHDLAVLKIAETRLPYLQMGSSADSPIGLTVLAIGNALGRYSNSVTKGIISGLARTVIAADPNRGGLTSLDNVIQTDAEINEGNSGGPLIDLEGKVIGINVAVDRGGSGLGFAIPIDDARSLIDSVRRTGRIIRVRLGVRYEMLDAFSASEKQLSRDYGALITKDQAGNPAIVPDSPADKAGLLEGDIIFEVNTIKLDGSNTLLSVIQRYQPGSRIGLKVQRGDKIINITAILDEFKAQEN